jgi:hypothetical protein
MSSYATSVIDLYFINKDTGFAVGKGTKPLEQSIILYTTNGGATWSVQYTGGVRINEYCWKVQRLTNSIYYASIQNLANTSAKVLRSVDGGMEWNELVVSPVNYNIQGVGFINTLKGWAGGDNGKSFETKDGGHTWDSISVCPLMNRVFRVNDTMVFATGSQIWKYNGTGTNPPIPASRFVSLNCHPNPVKGTLTIDITVSAATHVMLTLLDESGRRIKTIDNTDRPAGSHQFYTDTGNLPAGIYYVVVMTHEDKEVRKVVVGR